MSGDMRASRGRPGDTFVASSYVFHIPSMKVVSTFSLAAGTLATSVAAWGVVGE
jgi:hypothetical protein